MGHCHSQSSLVFALKCLSGGRCVQGTNERMWLSVRSTSRTARSESKSAASCERVKFSSSIYFSNQIALFITASILLLLLLPHPGLLM
jgi:hypothetical protein